MKQGSPEHEENQLRKSFEEDNVMTPSTPEGKPRRQVLNSHLRSPPPGTTPIFNSLIHPPTAHTSALLYSHRIRSRIGTNPWPKDIPPQASKPFQRCTDHIRRLHGCRRHTHFLRCPVSKGNATLPLGHPTSPLFTPTDSVFPHEAQGKSFLEAMHVLLQSPTVIQGCKNLGQLRCFLLLPQQTRPVNHLV